jgi:hypothetical protein
LVTIFGPVEDQTVIETAVDITQEVIDRNRSVIRIEFDSDITEIGF